MRTTLAHIQTFIGVGMLALVSGCMAPDFVAGPVSGASFDLEAEKARYASEPFAVRIIDRRKFASRFHPTVVVSPFKEQVGTIIIDTTNRLLYLIEKEGMARRYGIAVGAAGYDWSGEAVVARKAKWPDWYPTDDMRAETPELPQRIAGGSTNPLGARALYLYENGRDTLYRIHGTSEPWTIGTQASSGCIRMLDEDVIDLYERVGKGARVIVLPPRKQNSAQS